jgi:hypothetical protein
MLLRQYVSTAKGSVLSVELKTLIQELVKQFFKALGGRSAQVSKASSKKMKLSAEDF